MNDLKAAGAWVRARRKALGLSAMALARKAGLSVNYVSVFERGERLPRWDTARKICEALEVTLPEQQEFFRLVDLAGKPPIAQQLTLGLGHLGVGIAAWHYLPRLLEEVEHSLIHPSMLSSDVLLFDVVGGLASSLAWLALIMKGATRTQCDTMTAFARKRFELASDFTELYPRAFGTRNASHGVIDTASALPSIWRDQAFASPGSSAKLTRLLHRWSYEPRAFTVHARLSVHFKAVLTEKKYGFIQQWPTLVSKTHEAMIARYLWNILELDTHVGPYKPSLQELDLTVLLRSCAREIPLESDIASPPVDTLRYQAERGLAGLDFVQMPEPVSLPGVTDRQHNWFVAARSLDFAVRLFEVPQLGDAVFGCSREQLTEFLDRASDCTGYSPHSDDTAP